MSDPPSTAAIGALPSADPSPAAADLSAPPDPLAAWALNWGRLLRLARQVAGLSLTELSERTGLSKSYLSKLESGNTYYVRKRSGAPGAANPSRATLAALARALPSFRPLAHTLEPSLVDGGLAFEGVRSPAPLPPERPEHVARAPDAAAVSAGMAELAQPVHLGWRELEMLAALMALDAAALPQPITAVTLARATGRETSAVATTLGGLVASGVVVATPPARPGAPPSFRCAANAEARVGVTRLGDVLVLAATLLAGAPTRGPAQLRGRPSREEEP